MSLWNKSGKVPEYEKSPDKRNVIATKEGWVRRITYKDVHNNVRIKDEPLVAIGNLDSEASMGNPDIVEVYVANSTGGSTLKHGLVTSAFVVFTEPVTIGPNSSPYRFTVANTAGGNSVVATLNTDKTTIVNANNTLRFDFNVGTGGTYKIQAQTISNTATATIYSVAGGISDTVNTVISAAVSNNLSTFTIL